MIFSLPEDGIKIFAFFLTDPLAVPVVLGCGVLLLWKSRMESGFVDSRETPWTAPPWILATLLVGFFVVEILLNQSPLQVTGIRYLVLRDGLVVVFCLLVPVSIYHDRSVIHRSFGRVKPLAKLILVGVICGFGFVLLVLAASFIWPFSIKAGGYVNSSGTVAGLYQMVAVVLLIPVLEEWVFRGWLYPVFRSLWTIWGGVVVVSLLFAVLHGFSVLSIVIFLGSLVATILFEFTNSLLPGLVLHSGFNFLLGYGQILVDLGR